MSSMDDGVLDAYRKANIDLDKMCDSLITSAIRVRKKISAYHKARGEADFSNGSELGSMFSDNNFRLEVHA